MVTAAYSFSHFAVDLVCAFAVFSKNAGPWDYLLYNLFAFAMQMPLGLLADALNKNRIFALTGAVLAGLCCLLPSSGLFAFCVLGLGNGLFHIGGGLDVMNISGDRASHLGIFVSPGAFGVYIGTLWGKAGGSVLPILGTLLFACAGMLLFCKPSHLHPNAPVALPKNNTLLPALLLFLVVILRSVGGGTNFPWKTGALSFAAVCAVVLGKALGGILCDRIGMVKTGIFSLASCAAAFFFGNCAVAGLAGLLLFNMTMPITLFALSRQMPEARGFSFGILTFALFLGFLPGFFGTAAVSPPAMAALSILSCALLVIALKAGDGV